MERALVTSLRDLQLDYGWFTLTTASAEDHQTDHRDLVDLYLMHCMAANLC